MDHYETAPQDRIPFHLKVTYGFGAFVNNLLAAAIGGMTIVLNLGLGMNPALVGLLGALPRLTDAITDPLMGYISDNTRSRWGRRRPYISSALLPSESYSPCCGSCPRADPKAIISGTFLIGSFIFYLAYTMFATPWVALGYELTPDYHERTRLMGVQNFIGQLAYVVAPWFLLFMQNETLFDGMVDGAAGLAIIIAAFVIAVGILPAIFLRERFESIAAAESEEKSQDGGGTVMRNIKGFVSGFVTTLKFIPFLKLCVATFLVFNGFILVSSFQTYVIIYYVFGGDTVRGAEYAGYAGTLGAVSTFVVIIFVTWLGTHIGKRRAFFVAIGISMLGYASKWVCYNPDAPWLLLLPAPLIAFGLGGLFTLMPSMVADVVDMDELNTHERREGMYGSIFWWVVKLGMAAAIAGGGFMLNATGFDVALGGDQSERAIVMMRAFDAFVPALASAVAIWAVASFSITEERAHEIRQELEKRRGAASAPA